MSPVLNSSARRHEINTIYGGPVEANDHLMPTAPPMDQRPSICGGASTRSDLNPPSYTSMAQPAAHIEFGDVFDERRTSSLSRVSIGTRKSSCSTSLICLPFKATTWFHLSYLITSTVFTSIIVGWLLISLALTVVMMIIPPLGLMIALVSFSSWRMIANMDRFIILNHIHSRTVSDGHSSSQLARRATISRPHIAGELGPDGTTLTKRVKYLATNSYTWKPFLYFPFVKLPFTAVSCCLFFALLLCSLFGMFYWLILWQCGEQCTRYIPTDVFKAIAIFNTFEASLFLIPIGILLFFLSFLVLDIISGIQRHLVKDFLSPS
jgi:hypothetical protein